MVYEIYLYLVSCLSLTFFLLKKQRLVSSYGLKKIYLFLIWWTLI